MPFPTKVKQKGTRESQQDVQGEQKKARVSSKVECVRVNGRIIRTISRSGGQPSGDILPLSKSGNDKRTLMDNPIVVKDQIMYLLVSEMKPEQFMLGSIDSEESLMKQVQQEEDHSWSKALIVSPMKTLEMDERTNLMDTLLSECLKSNSMQDFSYSTKLVHALNAVEKHGHRTLQYKTTPIGLKSLLEEQENGINKLVRVDNDHVSIRITGKL